jgi:hypothetical protein
MIKRLSNKGKTYASRLSLYPLTLEQVLSAVLRIKPEDLQELGENPENNEKNNKNHALLKT